MENEGRRILLPYMDPAVVAREIEDCIVKRVNLFNATGGVIGLSGGVDSTTTAALAKRAFDRHNNSSQRQLELVGYMLPSKTNSPEDTRDGQTVAERLGIRYEVQSIENQVEAYRKTNPEAFENPFHLGNLTSRERANVLHTKAATEKKLVIGTGNKDEDFGIGYYTTFGDGAAHISPIGGLSKRLVRQMARYLGFEDLADRVPTAGLEPGQTDFKDLGYSYDAVELVMEGFDLFTEGKFGKRCPEEDRKRIAGYLERNASQIRDVLKRDFADYAKLYGEAKFKSHVAAVEDIINRHYDSAIPKGRLISPDIPQVTLDYKQ
ncbi:NAD(+) synthase [Candidatus Woesearchaeota archaeon]|nr:NAD(+) synthase [Candidatus Woesearchaeota archaeon]